MKLPATAQKSKPVGIYQARVEDIPALLPMLRRFNEFATQGGKHTFYASDIEATRILGYLITTQPFLTAWKDGKIVGVFAGFVSPHVFNPRLLTLTELLWWVEPEYRNGRAGLQLLESMIEWAKKNVQLFTMTLEHNSPVRRETMEKRGFRLREHNFILEV